jgi:hypothetical protein
VDRPEVVLGVDPFSDTLLTHTPYIVTRSCASVKNRPLKSLPTEIHLESILSEQSRHSVIRFN